MKNTLKILVLFIIGGLIYLCIELLYRGNSHWSMFIVGGIAFISIGLINEKFNYNIPLYKQCGIATLIITILEFVSGCIVNLWLGLNIWHYNILTLLGQISLPFIVIWYFLSIVGIVLDDILRWKLFKEEKPHYVIF